MEEKKNKKQKQLNSYIKYSSLTMQMAAIIVFGAFFGDYLDEKNDLNKIYTIIFSLLSIFFALYYVFKKIVKQNEKK